MKHKAMLACAFALALVFGASATEWFSDAVTAYPTGWEGTEYVTQGTGLSIKTTSDPDGVVTYTPDDVADLSETDAQVVSSVKFTAFEADDIPAVPETAKAGLILVDEQAEGTNFYGLVKVGTTNEWAKLAYTGVPTLDAAMTAKVTIRCGKVRYAIGDAVLGDGWYDIYLPGEQTVTNVSFKGIGDVMSLTGATDELAAKVTTTLADLAAKNISEISVTPNTACVTNEGTIAYTVTPGQDLTVNLTAAEGYLFANGTASSQYVITGGAIEDMALDLSEKAPSKAMASIDGQYYLTLQGAFDAAQAGETVKLETGHLISTTAMATNGLSFKFDLNGHSLTNNKSYAISIYNGSTLEILSSVEGGRVVKTSNTTMIEVGSKDETRGNLILTSGTIFFDGENTGDAAGSCVNVRYGTFVMNGGTLDTQNRARESTISTRHDSVTTINGGTLIGPYVFEDAGWTFRKAPSYTLAAAEGYTWVRNGEYDVLTAAGAKIGTQFYLSINEALDNVKANETIELVANNTLTNETIATDCTIQLAGTNLTVGAVTVNANVTVLNETADEGGLYVNGVVTVKAGKTLNASLLTWGAGGFIPALAGSLAIENTGKVLMGTTDGKTANWMAGNNPAFLSACATGAELTIGSDEYTLNAAGVWAKADDVAFAKISGEGSEGKGAISYNECFTTVAAAIAATTDNAVTVFADATVAASDAVAGLALTVASGAELTVTGSTLDKSVSIAGAGTLAISGALSISGATLDLGALTFAQTSKCTGGFALATADAKVIFPVGATFPKCTLAINSKVDGAKIVAAGSTYTWGNGCWTAGTAVARIGEVGFATFADAVKAITTNCTLTLVADVDGVGIISLDKNFTFDLNGKNLHIADGNEITNSAVVTFANTGAVAEKGLKNDGKIIVKENLDLSALQWGLGLVASADKTAKFIISTGKYVHFQAFTAAEPKNNPNKMEELLPGFLSGSEDGALFVNDETTYTFYTASTYWALGQQVVPEAETGLVYTGEEQTGVQPALDAQYTLTDNKATAAGDYVATATLNDEYVWTDGTKAAQQINWSIAKATPTITTAPTASTIKVGEALSESELTDGVASVAGAFAWTDGTETFSAAGTYDREVTFTATDTANYNTATCTASVTVIPAVEPVSLTIAAGDGVTSYIVSTNGFVVEGESDVYVLDEGAEVSIVATKSSEIKIPSWTWSANVTAEGGTATITVSDDATVSVSVKDTSEVVIPDPLVDPTGYQAAQAKAKDDIVKNIDLAPGETVASETYIARKATIATKIDKLATAGHNAAAAATYFNKPGITSVDVAKSDYVVASVELDTPVVIQTNSVIKVDNYVHSKTAPTFKLTIKNEGMSEAAVIEAAKAALEKYIKVGSSLTGISSAPTVSSVVEGLVTIAPYGDGTNGFMRVKIQQD